MIIALSYLGDAVHVVLIAVVLVVGHVVGRQVSRCSNVMTRGGGIATT
jgi:hypothetical protein